MPLAELPWQWKSKVIIGFSPRRRWNLREHTIGAVVKELWDISSPLFTKWLNDSANSTNNTFVDALKIFFHIWSESDLLKRNLSHTFVRFYKSKLRGQTPCQVGVVSASFNLFVETGSPAKVDANVLPSCAGECLVSKLERLQQY